MGASEYRERIRKLALQIGEIAESGGSISKISDLAFRLHKMTERYDEKAWNADWRENT